MRRWMLRSSVGLCVLLLAAPAPALPLWSWPSVRLSVGTVRAVASGVVYSSYRVLTADGPLSIHHLRVDLGNPRVRLGVGLAHDRLVSADEPVSSMARRLGAVAGVNGDFFDIHESGMPLNIVVRNGQLLRSPVEWAAFSVRKDGTAWIGRFRWSGAVTVQGSGATYPLSGYNSGFDPDGIVAVSSVLGAGIPPPPPGAHQTVAEMVLEPQPAASRVPLPVAFLPPPPGARRSALYVVRHVFLESAFAAVPPPTELLLVGQGRGALWLARAAPVGTQVAVRLATVPDWHDLHAAIGGGPILVQRGRLVEDPYPPAPDERDRRYPVVAVGLVPPHRSMLLVEVDGRQPRLSIGLTQPQLAAYMRWLGATDAMAFDSGGSATMVVRFPGHTAPRVVNSPSDGRERPVADALLVFSVHRPKGQGGVRSPAAAPPAPPPTATPPAPESDPGGPSLPHELLPASPHLTAESEPGMGAPFLPWEDVGASPAASTSLHVPTRHLRRR